MLTIKLVTNVTLVVLLVVMLPNVYLVYLDFSISVKNKSVSNNVLKDITQCHLILTVKYVIQIVLLVSTDLSVLLVNKVSIFK